MKRVLSGILISVSVIFVGFPQSVNQRKDENPARKTCSEYFKSYREQRMEIKITEYMICRQEPL